MFFSLYIIPALCSTVFNQLFSSVLSSHLLLWLAVRRVQEKLPTFLMLTRYSDFTSFTCYNLKWKWSFFLGSLFQALKSRIQSNLGRDPFNQNFRKFRSKTQWIGSGQQEKFRKNGSTFWGGPLFPVRPVGILVEWIAPLVTLEE